MPQVTRIHSDSSLDPEVMIVESEEEDQLTTEVEQMFLGFLSSGASKVEAARMTLEMVTDTTQRAAVELRLARILERHA